MQSFAQARVNKKTLENMAFSFVIERAVKQWRPLNLPPPLLRMAQPKK